MASNQTVNYTDDNIITLEWREHIRRRAGMYIGRLGNGDNPEDGIYVLVKEIVDNSIDEFAMGFGKQIQIKIEEGQVTIRDFGRGIPLNSVIKALVGRLMDLGYSLEVSKTAKKFIADVGFDPKYGARPLKRAVQRYVEDPVSETIIEGLERGAVLKVKLDKAGKGTVVAIG